MKKIFMFVGLFCVSAHAATMCVPDLSTCESCDRVSSSGSQWVADCCGVRVSGIGFFITDNLSLYTQSVPQTIEITISSPASYYGYAYVACLMTSPFVPKFYHVPYQAQYGSIGDGVGGVCSEDFNPKCAISGCDLGHGILSNGTGPA